MAEAFIDLVDIIYFTPDNAKFYKTQNGFAALRAFIPPVNKDDLAIEDGEGDKGGKRGKGNAHGPLYKEEGDKSPVWQDLGRVLFHRAFPYEKPDQFISVQDEEGREYGIIKNLADFNGEDRAIIDEALHRKYFCPEIKKINKLEEQFGYSLWEIETDVGTLEISLKDTFGSIIRISDTYLVIVDVSGNRYILPDVTALDRKSYRKIELYL